MIIKRNVDLQNIKKLLNIFPVVAILGVRQCGKTTISKEFAYNYFYDLENPRDLARLDNPQLALEDLEGLIVIDEIQRKPNLFPLDNAGSLSWTNLELFRIGTFLWNF